MRKTIITMLAAAFLLPLTLTAQSDPGNGPGCMPGHGMGMGDRPFLPDRHNHMEQGEGPEGRGIGQIMMMADELGLTEQQRDQIKKLQTEFKLQMIDKNAVVEKAEVQLRSTMMDQNASEVEVGRLIDDVARARADVQKFRFSHHKQVLAVLTPDQAKKLQELRKEHMEKRGSNWMGMGMGMGQRGNPPESGKHEEGGK